MLDFYLAVKGLYVTTLGLLVSSVALIYTMIIAINSGRLAKDTQALIAMIIDVDIDRFNRAGYYPRKDEKGYWHIDAKIEVTNAADIKAEGNPPKLGVTFIK